MILEDISIADNLVGAPALPVGCEQDLETLVEAARRHDSEPIHLAQGYTPAEIEIIASNLVFADKWGTSVSATLRAYDFDESNKTRCIALDYWEDAEFASKLNTWARNEVDAIVAHHISIYSDDKTLAMVLFLWLADSVEYCMELPDKAHDTFAKLRSPAYVLAEKRALCGGLARTYAVLCESAGIECQVVCGHLDGSPSLLEFESQNSTEDILTLVSEEEAVESNHSWNLVCIEGHRFYVDVTTASASWLDNQGRTCKLFAMSSKDLEKFGYRSSAYGSRLPEVKPSKFIEDLRFFAVVGE